MTIADLRSQIVELVRDFVKKDVIPVANELEADDIYPVDLVEKMQEMGLFGITIPEQYGGQGLDHTTFAMIFEELSKGWMSLSGIIGTHHVTSDIIRQFSTEEQKKKYLSRMASGEIRGGLALTESEAGSDVQNIRMTALREGNTYILNGRKMFITNGENGSVFAVLAKTDVNTNPAYKGISCFIVEKPLDGFSIGQKFDKLGYRGIDTCELVFDNCRISIDSLVGDVEGKGYGQVMNALEAGRINVAARAVGVASAALEAALKYSSERQTFGTPINQHQAIQMKLADMATKVHAARLLTYDAASKKDTGVRSDLEAGMAKLFASEICAEVTLDAMRIFGGYGYIKDLPLERYYRDAPLMIVGEGTNEIQRLVIAKRLIERMNTDQNQYLF